MQDDALIMAFSGKYLHENLLGKFTGNGVITASLCTDVSGNPTYRHPARRLPSLALPSLENEIGAQAALQIASPGLAAVCNRFAGGMKPYLKTGGHLICNPLPQLF
jgi:hypothetical protein